MTLYAPQYYKQFTCIADRCRHSCCIGWEIDIDDVTLQKYAALPSDCGICLSGTIEQGETPHFRLCEGERCPHLNSTGLCNLILTLGEDYLCDICREHPRFYHRTSRGMEVGLGMACEEACRLILSSEDYTTLVPIEALDDPLEQLPSADGFDAAAVRSQLYSLLSDHSRPYADRLRDISLAYHVTPTMRSDREWQALLDTLEYLDPAHKALFSHYTSAPSAGCGKEVLTERALAYWIFRHCSAAYDEDELRAALGFCLLCERLLASLLDAADASDITAAVPLARIISEELEYSEDNTDRLKLAFFEA